MLSPQMFADHHVWIGPLVAVHITADHATLIEYRLPGVMKRARPASSEDLADALASINWCRTVSAAMPQLTPQQCRKAILDIDGLAFMRDVDGRGRFTVLMYEFDGISAIRHSLPPGTLPSQWVADWTGLDFLDAESFNVL